MKAVRVGADGGVTVDEVEVPRIGPGDALVKAHAVGICGSDLLDWYVRRKAGSVLGHELAGEIVALGAGTRHFQVGDLVVPHHHAACMECQECLRGRFVHCARWRASRLDPGGMAELVRVPAENLERDTGRFSRDLSPEEACFTEPLATVVKAFRRGRFHHDDRLLVVGAGPAGQLAIRYAGVLGAREVAVADRVPWRLSVGERSGATRLFDVSRQPLRVAAGDAGFDFVFVCPGKSSAIAEAAGVVAPGGTLLVFTMPEPDDRLDLDGHELYFREVQVVPSYSCGPVEMNLARTLLAQRRVAVADLVSHRYPIGEAAAAFARARNPDGAMKVVLRFD